MKKSILAILATVFHCISIGILIGIYKKPVTISGLLLGICLYEWAESLAVGEILSYSSISKTKISLIIIFFSSCTPLGILIGISLEWGEKSYNRSFLLGISAGALLYICAAEIIASEFKKIRESKKGYVLYILGVFFATMLWVIDQRK